MLEEEKAQLQQCQGQQAALSQTRVEYKRSSEGRRHEHGEQAVPKLSHGRTNYKLSHGRTNYKISLSRVDYKLSLSRVDYKLSQSRTDYKLSHSRTNYKPSPNYLYPVPLFYLFAGYTYQDCNKTSFSKHLTSLVQHAFRSEHFSQKAERRSKHSQQGASGGDSQQSKKTKLINTDDSSNKERKAEAQQLAASSYAHYSIVSWIGISRPGQHLDQYLSFHKTWASKTTAFSEFVYCILCTFLLLYLYVRTAAWCSRTFKTLYFGLLSTIARIGSSSTILCINWPWPQDHCRLFDPSTFSITVSIIFCMKWAYKTTVLHSDSFTAFSLRYAFSIPIFRVSDLLVYWLLSWRRIKIGADAAGLRDNHAFYFVPVRVVRTGLIGRFIYFRQRHHVPPGSLDYDKRVSYS